MLQEAADNVGSSPSRWALRDCITNLRVGSGPLAPRGREVQASFGGLDLTVVSTTFEMWMGP